ncbi:hypothetical protein [Phytopseudomonas argentinensis]|nr:hypothetical protein [Pseudomonas argentinensis]
MINENFRDERFAAVVTCTWLSFQSTKPEPAQGRQQGVARGVD